MDHHDHEHMGHDDHQMHGSNAVVQQRQHEHHHGPGGESDGEGGMECSMQMIVSYLNSITM